MKGVWCIMEPIYSVTTTKSFEEAVKSVGEQTEANGFRVLYVHDVQETLAEKNFKIQPLKILEVCNAKFASNALEIDLVVSLLMPCKINVYSEEGKIIISTIRPTSLATIFNKQELRSFAEDVEKVLISIIDQSK
ncbi:Uncharacterized conserved protein, DUF302 family [Desulfosporosinus lacus DSM 15449]|uniref:Uncharacterized conserved protein, DUF302 family n=2 Tax=Desulfosporosinus TaxID=79206 RepID=A0A1M5ZPD9_9FIRM|nr:Uncharacterized conserved protein, DUF302 family [Desulfosporosinus lacus DSM 15449]